LARGIDSSTCWIESLEGGWLFLIPAGDNAGWLLAVGGTQEFLLAQSRIVAPHIEGVRGNAGQFPAYPRIADPFCGPGWLACGSAALGFDPLCGDGAGNAVREAILAAAIIRAEADGADATDVLAHYRGRLLAGFRKHLELCRQFYAAGHSGPWWNTELDFIQEGIVWCARQMNDSKPFQYRLSGFELHAISG
jgi:flavin-dependent dehydrogenase